MEQVTTGIDIGDFPARDVAMDVFRLHFPLPATGARVSKDGLTMTYRLSHRTNMEPYLKIARLTIVSKDLPLTAEIDQFKMEDVVIENTLIITYTGE